MNTLSEAEQNYLDGLEPEDRDQFRRLLLERKNRPPAETLEELTEKLAMESKKDIRENREKRQRLSAEIDKKLQAKAETSLSVFINSQLETGGTIDTKAIQDKGKSLGLSYVDVAGEIKKMQQLRRVLLGDEQ